MLDRKTDHELGKRGNRDRISDAEYSKGRSEELDACSAQAAGCLALGALDEIESTWLLYAEVTCFLSTFVMCWAAESRSCRLATCL
jgi:hypothetical protein